MPPLNRLLVRLLYRKHRITNTINGVNYIIEYSRSPFWTYERPSLWRFLIEKSTLWHGQVWEVFPNGGRCGFSHNCIRAVFPRRQMKDFLIRESNIVYKICYKDKEKK